jgi:hypothetical protein
VGDGTLLLPGLSRLSNPSILLLGRGDGFQGPSFRGGELANVGHVLSRKPSTHGYKNQAPAWAREPDKKKYYFLSGGRGSLPMGPPGSSGMSPPQN